ncbi:MAG: Bug family tripartite tricarboxylate transporter substrate binding protein [Burkholderiales bacterium]
MSPFVRFACAAAALSLSLASHQSLAQVWPAKPIRMVMSYAGGTEPLVRLVNQKVSESLGQPIILDIQPGANGAIGNAMVSRAAPDGYTLLAANATIVVRKFLVKDVPWDALSDFTPIRHLFDAVAIIAAHPSGPSTVAEMVETGKRSPGKLSYGTTGIGSAYHMAGELMQLQTGAQFVHVPYKGSPQSLTDLVAGRIPLVFAISTSTEPFVKAGKAKHVAVFHQSRLKSSPDVPTVRETLPGFPQLPIWGGYYGPAGLPRVIMQRFHDEVSKAMATPDVSALFDNAGLVQGEARPEQLVAKMKEDIAALARFVKAAGIQPE